MDTNPYSNVFLSIKVIAFNLRPPITFKAIKCFKLAHLMAY